MAKESEKEVNPYPGLGPFQDRDEDRLLFFGREDEQAQLLNLVLSDRLALLFSRSGLGKSSLINTALLGELRKRNYFPVVVRLMNDPIGGPISSVYECVQRETSKWSLKVDHGARQDYLWEYFIDAKFTKGGHALRPILILDQFEELFTVIRPQKDWEKAFTNQLADLVRGRVPEDILKKKMEELERLPENDPQRERLVSIVYEDVAPDVRVLISMREDFLPELESFRDQIPGIFRNRMRLEPLKTEQARRAIELPSQQVEVLGNDTFTFGPGVVDAMLGFLRRQRVGDKLTEGDTIEPAQLQVLCHYLNRQRREKKATQISLGDLKGTRGMKRIIANYYHAVVSKFPRFRFGWNSRRYRPSAINMIIFNRPRSAIRRLCEIGLIANLCRNSLMVDVIKNMFGVPELDLSRLVNERLLRTEPRLGSHFYELSHDALVEPLIMIRRRKRMARVLVGVLVLIALSSGVTYVYERNRHMRLTQEQLDLAKQQAVDLARHQAAADADKADQETREGFSQWQAKNYEESLKHYNSALEIYKSLGDRPSQARAYTNIGNQYDWKDQYPEAISAYHKALDIHTDLGDTGAAAGDLILIAGVQTEADDYTSAAHSYSRALTLYKKLGSDDGLAGQAHALRELGAAYRWLGDYPRAEDYLTQSLKLYSQLKEPQPKEEALANFYLATLYADRGDYDRSIPLLTKSRDILRDNGDLSGASGASRNLGVALFHEGKRAEAFASYQAALSGFKKIGAKSGIASTLLRIAQWYVEQGNCDKTGIEDANQAIAVAEQAKDQETAMESLTVRAEGFLCAKSLQNAAADAQRALDACTKTKNKSWEAANLDTLALVAEAKEDLQGAIENGQRAVDLYDSMGLQTQRARTARANLARWEKSLAAKGGTN